MHKTEILDVGISTGAFDSLLSEITDLPGKKPSSYVCFANVHMLVEAYLNPTFKNIVNKADIVTPDGRPLSLYLKYFRGINQDRVAGMDFMPKLLERASQKSQSVFLYGSTPEILKSIIETANKELPSLKICGAISPPFRPLTPDEKKRDAQIINNASPDFILVSLGCPKQETWMYENHLKINGCMLGLGQAFLVYAGVEGRPPKWIRDFSMEWIYRLYREPRRLWKRYLYTNSIFLWLIFRNHFKPSRILKNS